MDKGQSAVTTIAGVACKCVKHSDGTLVLYVPVEESDYQTKMLRFSYFLKDPIHLPKLLDIGINSKGTLELYYEFNGTPIKSFGGEYILKYALESAKALEQAEKYELFCGGIDPSCFFISDGKLVFYGFGLPTYGRDYTPNVFREYFTAPDFRECRNQRSNTNYNRMKLDVYSWSVVFAEVIFKRVFDAMTDIQKAELKKPEYEILRSTFCQILQKGLSKKPEERPSWAEVVKFLSEIPLSVNETIIKAPKPTCMICKKEGGHVIFDCEKSHRVCIECLDMGKFSADFKCPICKTSAKLCNRINLTFRWYGL